VAEGLAGLVSWLREGTHLVSEMDRAVWEAAKQYWFKSAHPGVWGLHTDVFIDGASQCFIGSACTLEIIDGKGKLVKRMPVFWGPGWRFAVIDRPQDDARELLIARQPTDSHALTVVNSKSLKIARRSYDGVPRGHTYVSGWSTMSRNHIFCDDLDGDGALEVVSEVNGIWNRVTVWSREGKPLHNAQFGPGRRIPARNIRDLDVADLDGDGRKEILAATSAGLVVALDCACKKVWSQRLPSPPNVLKCVTPDGGGAAWIVVGCDDGSVRVLDGAGRVVRQAKLGARVEAVELLRGPAGPLAALASAKGEVKGFVIADW